MRNQLYIFPLLFICFFLQIELNAKPLIISIGTDAHQICQDKAEAFKLTEHDEVQVRLVGEVATAFNIRAALEQSVQSLSSNDYHFIVLYINGRMGFDANTKEPWLYTSGYDATLPGKNILSFSEIYAYFEDISIQKIFLIDGHANKEDMDQGNLKVLSTQGLYENTAIFASIDACTQDYGQLSSIMEEAEKSNKDKLFSLFDIAEEITKLEAESFYKCSLNQVWIIQYDTEKDFIFYKIETANYYIPESKACQKFKLDPFHFPQCYRDTTIQWQTQDGTATLQTVASDIKEQLKQKGYLMKFQSDGGKGFIAITSMEQFNPDGTIMSTSNRWKHVPPEQSMLDWGYWESLIFTRYSHLRVLVFAVSGEPIFTATERIAMEELSALAAQGASDLPDCIADIEWDPNEHKVHFLVYEFEVPDTNNQAKQQCPTLLSAQEHFEAIGFWK